MPMRDVTVDEVRARLDYDPSTGIMVWRKRPGNDHQTNAWNAKFWGKTAGSKAVNGYMEVGWVKDGARFRSFCHRLAWAHFHGAWPSKMIDHIDGDRSNNRIANLREATGSQNAWNTGARSWSKSGVKGVSWDKERGKWFASIFVNRKQIALGRYDNIDDAAVAYADAARRYHGEFANTG